MELDRFIGEKIGKWTILCLIKKHNKHGRMYKCQCVCGRVQNLYLNMKQKKLTSNSCISCAHKKHGKSYHELYRTWIGMKFRCYNKKSSSYPHYGGRGIKICERWLDNFDNFCEDMGERPKNCSIDRINIDGDYEPGNCKWSNPREQAHNRTTSLKNKHRYFEFKIRKDKITKDVIEKLINQLFIYSKIT